MYNSSISSKLEREILEKFWKESPPPYMIKPLVAKLGIKLEFTNDDDTLGELLYDRATKKYTITLNRTQVETRMRFTAAHEIAHYLLHKNILVDESQQPDLFQDAYPILQKLDRLENTKDRSMSYECFARERDANELAAEILMPLEAIIFEYSKAYDITRDALKIIEMLAGVFKVSKEAMRIKLETLGFIEKR